MITVEFEVPLPSISEIQSTCIEDLFDAIKNGVSFDLAGFTMPDILPCTLPAIFVVKTALSLIGEVSGFLLDTVGGLIDDVMPTLGELTFSEVLSFDIKTISDGLPDIGSIFYGLSQKALESIYKIPLLLPKYIRDCTDRLQYLLDLFLSIVLGGAKPPLPPIPEANPDIENILTTMSAFIGVEVPDIASLAVFDLSGFSIGGVGIPELPDKLFGSLTCRAMDSTARFCSLLYSIATLPLSIITDFISSIKDLVDIPLPLFVLEF